jgi:hypothetical protein
MNTLSEHIIIADNKRVIISSKYVDDSCLMSKTVLSHMSKWFTANKFVLNLNKINVLNF